MANLKVDTVSGIGTEGPVLNGGLHFRSKNYLTLPKGTTAERTATSSGISTVIGAIRYNTDSNKMECYVNNKWMIVSTSSPNLDGGTRGLIVGGQHSSPGPGVTNVIEKITISTAGNGTDFGDLLANSRDMGSAASRTRGLTLGRANNSDVISFVTIAQEGNAIDFGNLTTGRRGGEGVSNQTRAVCAGGNNDGGTHYNIIDFITIASTGNALDFGDLTTTKNRTSGAGSPTRGIFYGGAPGVANNIDYITIATTGNAQDFGDTLGGGGSMSAVSSSTRLVAGEGSLSPTYGLGKIEIATLGNSAKFGDMLSNKFSFAAMSDCVRGVFAGGDGSPAQFDSIEYFNISTEGTMVDFGDISFQNQQTTGLSNGHGGL